MSSKNKYCTNQKCKFYTSWASGCSEEFHNCPFCGIDLTYDNPNIHQEEESKVPGNLWKISSKPNLSANSKNIFPALTISINTVISLNSYSYHNHCVTIRFKHKVLGKEDVNTEVIEKREFDGKQYVKLEGKLHINAEQLYDIWDKKSNIMLYYKYYLNGVEEELFHRSKELQRSVELLPGNNHFIEKYDQMPLQAEQVYSHNLDSMVAKNWRISLNLMLPDVSVKERSKPCHTIEDLVIQFKKIVKHICYSSFFDEKKTCLFLSEKEISGKRDQLVKDWLLIQLDSRIHAKNYMYVFYVVFLIIGEYNLASSCDLIFKRLFEGVNDEDILSIIEGSLWVTNRISEPDKLLKTISETIETILFVDTKRLIDTFRFLPLYHHLFDKFKEFEFMQSKHDFPNERYWGLSQSIGIPKYFTKIDPQIVQRYVTTFSRIDRIYSYSILLLTCQRDSLPALLKMREFPIDSFLSLIVYRIYKGNCSSCNNINKCKHTLDSECRIHIYTSTLDKLQTEASDLTDRQVETMCNSIFWIWENMEQQTKFSLKPTFQECNELLSLTAHLLTEFEKRFVGELTADSFKAQIKTIRESTSIINVFQNVHEKRSDHFNVFDVVKICDFMLTCDFPKVYEWDTTVIAFLTSKLKHCDYRILVGVLTSICQDADLDLHIDVRLTQIIQRSLIDFLTSCNSYDSESDYIASKLEGVSNKHKKKIFSLYSTILLKQKNKFEYNHFYHVATWDLWKTYFRTDLLPEHHEAKEESVQFIVQAENIFLTLVVHLFENKITVKLLNLVIDNKVRIIILFQMQSIKQQGIHEVYGEMNIEEHIDNQSELLEYFKKRREEIRNLQNFTNPMLDICEFSNFLSIDFDGMSWHCVVDYKHFLLPGNEISEAINSPESQIMLSTSEYLCNSQIFYHILQKLVSQNEQLILPLSVYKFYEQFWLPSFVILEELIESLSSLTIPLSRVEEYFTDYKENRDLALKEFSLIASAVRLVSNKEITECQLTAAIDKVIDYFKLHHAFEIAPIIIGIQKSYGFQGDFSEIVSLIETNPQLKDQQLNSINDQLLTLAELLVEFSEQEKEILKTLLAQRDFIGWVHKTFKDRNELKVFTDLVHTFCIDQPLQTETNTQLYGVCLDFAPLIFDLDRQVVNSHAFLTTCKNVVEDLITSKFLRSFETTTFNLWLQMKDIHASTLHGIREELTDIMSGSIALKLEPGSEMDEIVLINFNGKNLSFIKELDSIITFLEDDESVNCSLFREMFKSITSLSILVKTLHLSGHFNYRQYALELPCTPKSLIHLNKLIQDAREMLGVWTQQLHKARMDYYYLNYYTPTQIVSLQIELYKFQSSGKLDTKHLNLLSIIKQDVRVDEITSCMEKAGCTMSVDLCSGGTLFSSVGLAVKICSISSPIKEERTENITIFPTGFTQEEKELCEVISETAEVSIQIVIKRVAYLKEINMELNRTKIKTYCLSRSSDDVSIESEQIAIKPTESEPKVRGSFLSLRNLGTFLKYLINCNHEILKIAHEFPQNFCHSMPNLICVQSSTIIQTLLSLYLGPEGNHPLPYNNEILFCSSETTSEEVDMFWRRALFDPNTNHLYCIVYIEKLVYQVAAKSVSQLNEHLNTQSHHESKLVLLCTDQSENSSFMALAFQHCRREAPTNLTNIKQIQQVLFNKFSYKSNRKLSISQSSLTPALNVDPDLSYIRMVVSTTVGAGKSLAIQRLASDLESYQKKNWNPDHYNIISIHGVRVEESGILKRLKEIRNSENGQIYHFDIAPSVRENLVPFLFKLLILGVISDFSGNIWCCNRKNYYVVELLIMRDPEEIDDFFQLFPIIFCHQPGALVQTSSSFGKCDRTIDEQFMKSSKTQRAFAYLDRKAKQKPLDSYQIVSTQEPTYTQQEFLKTLISNCGVENPSWSELNHFITFFINQMLACEGNDFYRGLSDNAECREFKSFIVKYMIIMSKDFATPSKGNDHSMKPIEMLLNYSVLSRKRWEQQTHPYIFFHQDQHSMTFLGINIKNGNLIDMMDPNTIIEHNVVSNRLEQMLRQNGLFRTNPYQASKEEWIAKLQAVIGFSQITDPDEHYVLTLDNVMKILAIHMRFRCNIPVIIMGETGCGKTKLVQYMSLLQKESDEYNQKDAITNMIILKMHGGTTRSDVISKLQTAIELAKENSKRSKQNETILFFDEANTSSSIGLIKEILCDRRYNGKSIPSSIRLQFVATCNPYRKHTPEMIRKLDSAGYFKHHLQKTEHFGGIPLRELVYRVMEIPPSLFPLVWDFGQLSADKEHLYIQQIVRKHLHNSNIMCYAQSITHVLAATQEYLRTREDECSFVSLRDIGRCMRVMLWFYEQLGIFQVDDPCFEKPTYSLLLAIGVCYRAKLIDRQQFDRHLTSNITHPLNTIDDASVINREILKFQTAVTDHMIIDDHIAKNASLKENIFMMFVCIELRIPLFLIGKPGSSKSLAKSIICHSMEGQSSRSDSKLRNFKEVFMVSYQCSQLSTPDGIKKVFTACENIQKGKSDKLVACAVLDETGLAENCPNLPLKLLHPLLEEPSDSGDCQVAGNSVAFLGISNWALDPAKMNRGIMVNLQDPTENELIRSAYAICQSNKVENVIYLNRIQPHIPGLARGYLEMCEVQKKHGELSCEYFGLRDFYSLLKMICYLCMKYETELNDKILLHAVTRNFGGLIGIDAFNTFRTRLDLCKENEVGPSSTWLDLIRTNLNCTEDSLFGCPRYLLLLTENLIALNIILESRLLPPNARILFGSAFNDSNDSTVISKHIHEIKNCMETGRTLVLLKLSYLYESLYDTLNQYFLRALGRRWVDIGLGNNRMKCPVDVNFKLIVIADRDEVYKQFPSPLINRFEKHTLTMSTVLTQEENTMVNMLNSWAMAFSKTEKTELGANEYLVSDCFIGFQKETPSLIVYNVVNQDNKINQDDNCLQSMLKACKLKLLKMATPDSIVRILHTPLKDQYNTIREAYLGLHILNFVDYIQTLPVRLVNIKNALHSKSVAPKNQIYVYSLNIVTTHSPILTIEECQEIQRNSEINKENNFRIYPLNLLQFQSEEQFVKTITDFISNPKVDLSIALLIIQCENGHDYSDHILYAMHRIREELFQARNRLSCDVCLVFIIRLPRMIHGTCFSSFYGGEWDTAHVDELRIQKDLMSVYQLSELSMAELFKEETNISFRLNILRRCVQPAVSQSRETVRDKSMLNRRIESFNSFLDKTNQELHPSLLLLLSNIFGQLKSPAYTDNFAKSVAFNEYALQSAGTFYEALLQQINTSLVPVLAGVISYLDTNDNLRLFQNLKLQEHEIPTKTLWSTIFVDNDNIFNHAEAILASLPDEIEEASNYTETQSHFQSSFPFSWLINPLITHQLLTLSKPELQSIEDFELSFKNTDLAKMIIPIIIQERNVFIIFLYLKDFISLNLKSPDGSSLTEIERSIYRIMLAMEASKIRDSLRDRKELEMFFDRTGFGPDLHDLPDLTIPNFHVAFKNLENKLNFIKQAFYTGFIVTPDADSVIGKMKKRSEGIQSTEYFEPLDAFVFRTIIEDCKSDLYDAALVTQLKTQRVRQFQQLIDNNWDIVFPNVLDHELWKLWNGIIAIDLIITKFSHLLSLISVQQAVTRMIKLLDAKDTDFQSSKTLEYIFSVLMIMVTASSKEISTSNGLKCSVCEYAPIDPLLLPCSEVACRTCCIPGIKSESENSLRRKSPLKQNLKNLNEQNFMRFQREQNTLIKTVMRCLMEVISSINFSNDNVPLPDEEDLINLLFEYITLNQNLYENLNEIQKILFKEGILKPSVPFRMFLLQLLLKERYDETCNRMNVFFNSLVSKGKHQESDAREIIIIFLHCLEDTYFKRLYLVSSFDKQVDFCTAETDKLSKYPQDFSIVTFELVDSVAKMKFIAHFVSKQIIHYYNLRRDYMCQLSKLTTKNYIKQYVRIPFELLILIGKFKSLSVGVSENLTLYLLKCIFYQLGWAGIQSLRNNEALLWILPAEHREFNSYTFPYDLFSVLLPDYMTYRETFETYVSTPKSVFKTLSSKKKMLPNRKKIEENIVLSIFKAKYSNTRKRNNTEISIQERDRVNEFARTFLDQSYQSMEPFINQSLSGNGFLNGTFQDLLLNQSTSGTTHIIVEILCHLFVLLGHSYQDATLVNFLSPLMLIYTNPIELSNRLFPAMQQENVKGHTLGSPFERQADPPAVRNISAATVSIIRAIMHGIFILSATMSNLETPTNITRITANLVDNLSIAHFYTLHLFRDLTDLSVSTGKYLEEAAIIIHLVIDAVIHCKPLEGSLYKEITFVNFPNNWEVMFDKLYITPILSKIDSNVQDYISLIRKDSKTEENPILRILLEIEIERDEDIFSKIWCYRSVFDSQHFKNKLFSRGLQKLANHPFLAIFCKNRNLLSATIYLPDIVQLMLKLSHKKYMRIIKKDGTNYSIGQFVEKIKHELGKSESEELERLITSYRSAWSIVNRLFPQDKRLNQRGLDTDVSLACLVPTRSVVEPNIVAVANILINTHNTIVRAYTDSVSIKKYSDETTEKSIPLSMITNSHMIDCENQLDSLILSCARYSLKPGLGTQITYDYKGIERGIVDRFIRSKLTIDNEKIYSAARQDVIVNIFKKVEERIPQDKIEKKLQDHIHKSLPTPEKVSYVLEHVEVAIKFIASLGGQPDTKIYNYLHNTLKYQMSIHRFSSAISQFCCLKHIIHLWNLLSVRKAKLLVANNQYPFGSLSQYFYQPLAPEQEMLFRSYFHSLNTEYTLDIIHNYIVSYMKLLSADEANSDFLQSFSKFAKETCIKIPDEFKGGIFKLITVSNTVALWSLIASGTAGIMH